MYVWYFTRVLIIIKKQKNKKKKNIRNAQQNEIFPISNI